MSRRSTERCLVVGLVLLLAGCQSTPTPSSAGATACRSDLQVGTGRDAEVAVAAPCAPADVDKKSLALFDDSVQAMEAERWQDAEVLLMELTTREPRLPGPWVNLGIAQSELGNDEAAEASLRRALEIDPNNCAAYTELGLLRRRAGDFLAAEANYLACVQRVPDFREAHLNLGVLYELYLGRLPEALDAYRAYLALLDGEDARVEGWVSNLERRLGRERES
jgi:tetratricopeptide (TPR) repeat protein